MKTLAPGAVLSITLATVTFYVSQDGYDMRWRCSFPGWGACAVSLTSAIRDALVAWRSHGSPKASRYLGPTPSETALEDLKWYGRPDEADACIWAELARMGAKQ